MLKLHNISITFAILFCLINDASGSFVLKKNTNFSNYEMEKIIKNSFGFFSKVKDISFKEGNVYRKLDEPFLDNEEIANILKKSTNLPLPKKVENLDFDNDIIRFKK
jgi:hypothetical protein